MELLRDRSDDLDRAGVRRYGISRDSPWTHIAWSQALDLNFPLLSDWNGDATRAFGVEREFRGLRGVAARSAFLVDAQKPRALLALLLLDRNRVVATDRLVDELWGDAPPAQATKTLQVYVSQLRKELGPQRLVTRAPGYELRVADGELDLDRFDPLVRTGREQPAAGGAAAAASTLRDALALWRGPAL